MLLDRIENLRVFGFSFVWENATKLQKNFELYCILEKYLLLSICIPFPMGANNFLREQFRFSVYIIFLTL
jgi:hypothetical protein